MFNFYEILNNKKIITINVFIKTAIERIGAKTVSSLNTVLLKKRLVQEYGP